jgi:hypothetical protein
MTLEIELEGLCFWVVYRDPLDYPGKVVLRRQWARDNGRVVVDPVGLVFDSLEGARDALPAGLVNIGRQAADDRSIAEVWI